MILSDSSSLKVSDVLTFLRSRDIGLICSDPSLLSSLHIIHSPGILYGSLFRTMDQLKDWTDDALSCLKEAEGICGSANSELVKINQVLSKRDNLLLKLTFLFDASRQQIRLLAILKDSLVKIVKNYKTKNHSWRTKITRDCELLRSVLDTLHKIELEPSFRSTQGNKALSLYHFVSDDKIDELFNGVDDILRESTDLYGRDEIDNNLADISREIEGYGKELEVRYAEFILNEVPDTPSKGNKKNSANHDNIITKLITSNNELETDMASLLESLTNHFDQCKKGQDLLSKPHSEDQKRELLQVLENDSLELPYVINILNQDYQSLKTNCSHLQSITNKFSIFYNNFTAQFMVRLKLFGEVKLQQGLNIITKKAQRVEILLEKAFEYEQSVVGLIDYYTNFVSSYRSLILEIERRRKINDQVEAAVSRFRKELQSIEEKERTNREDFLIQHADYLPQDIISPNLLDGSQGILFKMLPTVGVEFNREPLPKISRRGLEEARIAILGRK